MSGGVSAQERALWIKRARRDSRLTMAARLVAAALGDFVNLASGRAWPSQETLAAAAGVSRPTVKRALRALRELRYIAAAPGRGRGHTTAYTLGRPLSAIEAETARKGVTHDPFSARAAAGKRGQEAPIKGVTGDPQNKRRNLGKRFLLSVSEQSSPDRLGGFEAAGRSQRRHGGGAMPAAVEASPAFLPPKPNADALAALERRSATRALVGERKGHKASQRPSYANLGLSPGLALAFAEIEAAGGPRIDRLALADAGRRIEAAAGEAGALEWCRQARGVWPDRPGEWLIRNAPAARPHSSTERARP